jgi:hypothetical protein
MAANCAEMTVTVCQTETQKRQRKTTRAAQKHEAVRFANYICYISILLANLSVSILFLFQKSLVYDLCPPTTPLVPKHQPYLSATASLTRPGPHNFCAAMAHSSYSEGYGPG